MLIDTHAHLYWDSFKADFDQVLTSCLSADVTTIINVGVDLHSSQTASQMENSQVKFYSSIGLHPHEAHNFSENTDTTIQSATEKLEEIYHQNPQKVIAVGECGLDYFFHGNSDFTDIGLSADQLKSLQKTLFKAQIELAKKLDLPLLIHCRDAWNDIFDDLAGTKGLFHTFSGTETEAKKALDLSYYLSFSGTITYPKNESLREIVKSTPLDKILTETDCPFLPPQSIRGQRNDPSSVKEITELIADLKNLSFEETANQIFQNAQTLFNI